jgi:hypothetical protein
MRPGKRLSEYSSKELEALYGDAIRRAQSGTPEQRADAEEILPRIGAEVERRIRRLKAKRPKD